MTASILTTIAPYAVVFAVPAPIVAGFVWACRTMRRVDREEGERG